MTPSEANDIIAAAREQFGWAVQVYDRTVAEDAIGHPLSDDEWRTVAASPQWLMLSLESQADRDHIWLAVMAVTEIGAEVVQERGRGTGSTGSG